MHYQKFQKWFKKLYFWKWNTLYNVAHPQFWASMLFFYGTSLCCPLLDDMENVTFIHNFLNWDSWKKKNEQQSRSLIFQFFFGWCSRSNSSYEKILLWKAARPGGRAAEGWGKYHFLCWDTVGPNYFWRWFFDDFFEYLIHIFENFFWKSLVK